METQIRRAFGNSWRDPYHLTRDTGRPALEPVALGVLGQDRLPEVRQQRFKRLPSHGCSLARIRNPNQYVGPVDCETLPAYATWAQYEEAP